MDNNRDLPFGHVEDDMLGLIMEAEKMAEMLSTEAKETEKRREEEEENRRQQEIRRRELAKRRAAAEEELTALHERYDECAAQAERLNQEMSYLRRKMQEMEKRLQETKGE